MKPRGKAQARTAKAVPYVRAASEAQNLAKRFHRHGESYLRFVTTPGIEPTNNLAEQAIRFVVIDRHITQGSRSEAGRRSPGTHLDHDRDLYAQRRFGFQLPA